MDRLFADRTFVYLSAKKYDLLMLGIKKNIRLIILPPIIGGIAAILSLLLIQQLLEKFYYPYDPDPVFNF